MKLLKIIKAYFNGNLVVVIKNDNRFDYMRGERVDNKFLCNSLTQIIRLNIK